MVLSHSVQTLILNIVQKFLSVLVLSTNVVLPIHRGVSTPVFPSHILFLPWLNMSKKLRNKCTALKVLVPIKEVCP